MTDLDSTLRSANAQWKGESEKLAGGDISGPTFIARSELSDSGPRKCKDIAWLAVFLLFLFGNVVILGLAALSGDPYKLVFDVEYTGQVCGGSYSTASTLEFSKRLNVSVNPLLCFSIPCTQCDRACPTLQSPYLSPRHRTAITLTLTLTIEYTLRSSLHLQHPPVDASGSTNNCAGHRNPP